MSDLTRFRDHCRKMAENPTHEKPLWTQLADEIDEYLAQPAATVDLFGEVTPEPVVVADDA